MCRTTQVNVTSTDTASYLQECLKCLKIKKTDNACLSVREGVEENVVCALLDHCIRLQ